jgi:hypothetical protein
MKNNHCQNPDIEVNIRISPSSLAKLKERARIENGGQTEGFGIRTTLKFLNGRPPSYSHHNSLNFQIL